MPRRTPQSVAGDQGVEVMPHIRGVELARQAYGARERRGEDLPGTAELGAQKTVIESDVVGHETTASEPRPQLIGDRRERQGVGDHFIRDAGEALDGRRDAGTRVDQRAPLPLDLTAVHPDHCDFGDPMPSRMPPRGFDIDEGDRCVEPARPRSVLPEVCGAVHCS